MITALIQTPDDHDSDTVSWKERENGPLKGYGYRGKEGDDAIHIIRCPVCSNENYMAQEVCIHCGFRSEK